MVFSEVISLENSTAEFTLKKSKEDVLKDLNFMIDVYKHEGTESEEDQQEYDGLVSLRDRVAAAEVGLITTKDDLLTLYAASETRRVFGSM